jgi:uncharacterized membrane protein
MSEPTTLLPKARLETLIDGVFAVVITLLVLDLRVEQLPSGADHAGVWHALEPLIRPLVAYLITFVLTGVFWTLQHRMFNLLAQSSVRHVVLTLGFLLFVTLLPVSVSILVSGIRSRTAFAIYFGNMALIAFMLMMSWFYAGRAGLRVESRNTKEERTVTRGVTAMTLGNVLAAAIGTATPALAALGLLAGVVIARVLIRAPKAAA